jgi:hypothetical protein
VQAFNLLKRIAALCLFISLFLPLSQCTVQKESVSEQATHQLTEQTSASTSVQNIKYAYSADQQNMVVNVINVFAFIWPLLFSVIVLIHRQLEQALSVPITVIGLCLLSIFCLLRLSLFGELLVGAYLAWCSILAYFVISLCQFLQRVRNVWHLVPNNIH